jgi:hypothetical protein
MGFLSTFGNFAYAANETWVNLASSANGDYKSYLDTDSFEQMGTDKWAVWVKMQYAEKKRDSFFGSSYTTDLRRMLFDCKAKSSTTMQRTRQDEEGVPISQEQWPESKWVFNRVGPRGGTNHTELESICSLGKMSLRRFNFSRAGQWLNFAGGFSIDVSASLHTSPWLFYRGVHVEVEQRRINDKKLFATISYTALNCQEQLFGIYGLGSLGENDEILSSSVVTLENIKFLPIVKGSISSAIQEKYCAIQNPTKEQTAVGNPLTQESEARGKDTSLISPRPISAHAIVIGNSAYPEQSRLANPSNDAKAIAERLRGFGFIVTLVLDSSREQLITALAEFRRSAATADLGLLFYAGHGIQVSGTNYMIPTDLDFKDPTKAPLQGVSMTDVVERYLPGKVKLVFLDACRDNPLTPASGRGLNRGLAPINVAEGTLISYATKDGQVADDGQGQRNSPFTTALLEHLGDPDDIAVVMRKVREKVMKATNGKQQPWEYGSLTGGQLVLSAIRPNSR